MIMSNNNKLYISYSDDSRNEGIRFSTSSIVKRIKEYFGNYSVSIIEYSEQEYKAPVPSFINSIIDGDHVVVILTQDYFESIYCMQEAVGLVKKTGYLDKIYPILVNIDFFSPKNRISIIKYWEDQCNEFNQELKQLQSETRKKEMISFLEKYEEIEKNVPIFLEDMLSITLFSIRTEDDEKLSQIFKHIYNKIFPSLENPASPPLIQDDYRQEKMNLSPRIYYRKEMLFTKDVLIEEFNRVLKGVLESNYVGIKDTRALIGRKKFLEEVLQNLYDGEAVRINGTKSCGKTSVLQALASESTRHWLKEVNKLPSNAEQYTYLYVNMRDYENYEDFYKFVVSHYNRENGCHFRDFYQLFENLEKRDKGLVLLLDNYDSTLKREGFPKQFYNYLGGYCKKPYFRVVFSHNQDIKLEILAIEKKAYLSAKSFELGLLEEKSIDDFLVFPVEFEIVNAHFQLFKKKLFELGGTHPLFLSIARKKLYEIIIDDNQIEVDKLLKLWENMFSKTAVEYYEDLLISLSIPEHELLYQYLSQEMTIYHNSKQLDSFLILKNETCEAFSEAFRIYYLRTHDLHINRLKRH